MFNIITNIFGNIFTRHSSSFLSSLMILKYVWTWIKNAFSMIVNLIVSLMWVIIRWILGVIEAFEYIVNSMLGIQNADGTLATPSDYINYAYMNVEGGVDFVNGLVKVFKAMVAVAIVLLIVFTIIAIVRQEFANAQAGFEKKSKEGKSGVGNDKTGIMAKLFKNIIYIIVLPLSMLFVIVGVNAVLNAFANALGAAKGTVAGQVLASSTYDANRYRKYANADKRSPIIISAYDSTDYAPDRAESFALRIRSVSVQDRLKKTAEDIAYGNFLSFSKSLSYQNNKISNSADYGSYYEQFVCTAEQYQVMADFIDAAELMNLEYTIKSIDDPEVSWKYVDDAVYSQSENTLTINYRDASDLNANGKDNDVYTMVYSPANEITSPLQDALNSIMAMLGAGEYSDNQYNMMERDDSGNFVNLVQWANEKAMIKLSNKYDPTKHYNTWQKEDQVIIYELNHFSSNNTFGDATISDLKNGIELDVKQIVYRTYYPEADAYSPDKTIDCVHINGSYYPVKVSKDYADKFGNPYYELDIPDDVNFLETGYSLLKKSGSSATLTLSGGFDINNINTWTTSDQIIVYEYYKDLSYNNSLSKFKFSDFESGVTLTNSTYTITPMEDKVGEEHPSTGGSGEYVLINGTYYKLTGVGGTLLSSGSTPGGFMGTLDAMSKIHYDFKINVSPANSTDPNYPYYEFVGANTLVTTNFSLISGTPHQSGVSLRFSNNFKYKDITTWTYKDYFIFYMYIKYNVATSLDEILYRGIVGNIVKASETSFYFVPQANSTISVSMDNINSISDLNIQRALNLDEILENNEVDTATDKLFINFDENSSIHLKNAESRQFTLSDTYDYYDVSTWTVVDLLLTYLSSKEVICDMDTLKLYGYYAIKFETEDDGVVYRFGVKGGASTVYLSEKNVKALRDAEGRKIFPSFNAFLTGNAYKFITQFLGFSEKELISTKEDLVNNIFSSYDSYILNTAILASNLIDARFGNLNPIITEYTYQNSSFVRDDFSTWNNMDIALYCITGSATGLYKSYVVRGPSGEFEADGTTPILHDYFIVKDKAINISTGAFKCTPSVKDTKNNTADLEITSTTLAVADSTAVVSNASELSTYVKSLSYVKSAPGVINLSSALRYKYVATSTIDKINITGSLENSTILDLIIAETSGKVEDGKAYYYNIYTDGIFSYIKVGGLYVEVYDNTIVEDEFKYIKYKQAKMYLSSSNDSSSNIIQAYDTHSYLIGNDAVEKFSYLDTIIYSITNSLEVRDYAIYKVNGVPYVNINGMLIQTEHTFMTDEATPVSKTIKFVDEIDVDTDFIDLSYEVPGAESTETTCDHVGYLYDNYYSKHISSGVASYDYIYERVKYTNNFDIKNVKTWSPLGLLLYRLGVNSFSGGRIYQKDTDYYLYFTHNIEGVLNAYYIDVTDLIDASKLIKIEDGDTAENSLNGVGVESVKAIKIMRLRAFYSTNIFGITNLNIKGKAVDSTVKKIYNYKIEGAVTNSYLSYEEILVLYQTLKNEFNTIIADVPENTLTEYKGNVKPLESVKRTHNSTIDLNTPTSWTWFDLIIYDFTGKINTGDYDYYIYVSNNEEYVEFSSDIYGKLYAISNSGIDLFKKFEADGSAEEISYSNAANQNNTLLELIYYKITGNTSGSVVKYKYPVLTGDTAEPFYLIQDPRTGETYGIYQLPTGVDDIKFSSSSNNIQFVMNDSATSHNWNVFDFIVLYAKAHTDNDIFFSDIYTYNGKSYYLVADNYIDIKALGYDNSAITSNSGKDFVSLSGTTLISKYNLGAILGITGTKFDTVSTTFVADSDQMCITYDKLSDDLKTAITDFYTGDYTITNVDEPADIYTTLFDNNNATYVSFSQDFDASDYSTWTLSDILIYYAVYNNFYTNGTDKTFIYNGKFKVKDGTGAVDYVPEQMKYFTRVFQSYVANRYVPAYIYNIVNEDAKGSANVYKSISLSNKAKNPLQIYFNYDVFEALKTRKPAEIFTTDTGFLGLSIYEPNAATIPNNKNVDNFTYASNDITNIVDFVYKNYYFYNLNNDKFALYGLNNKITPGVKEAIAAGLAPVSGTINLALVDESGAEIDAKDVETWNLLHLIAIYEFSRPIKNNVFKNSTFEDLFADNYFLLYSISDTSGEKILFINGNYYNLTDYVTKVRGEASDIEYRLKSVLTDDSGSNAIWDEVDDKVALTNDVITYLIDEYIKNWYRDDRYIKDIVEEVNAAPSLALKSEKAKEVLSKIGGGVYFKDHKEIFNDKELATIEEHKKYLNETPDGSKVTNIYDYVIGQLPEKIYKYAKSKIEEYIKDTIDETTFEYKFEDIRDNLIVEKIVGLLLDTTTYRKEEPADSGTFVPIEISEINSMIKLNFVKNVAKYEQLVIYLRTEVVKDEKIGNYTADEVRTKLQNAVTRAFITAKYGTNPPYVPENIREFVLVESESATPPEGVVEVTYEDVANALVRDEYLTIYEKIYLLGYDAFLKYDTNANHNESGFTDIDDVPSILLVSDGNDFEKDTGTGVYNKQTSALTEGVVKVYANTADCILKNILDYKISLSLVDSATGESLLIKYQTDLISSTRIADQNLAIQRMHFVKKPYEMGSYDYKFLKLEGEDYDEHGCLSTEDHEVGVISSGTVNNYTFRTNFEDVSFVKKYTYTDAIVLGTGAETCSYDYSNDGSRVYRKVDANVKDAVKINLDDPTKFGMYEINPMVKTVSWPQKLMEDMQVLYPDLNWATLIATDGWLDTLGEFTSAYANGQFISKGNSSNTTAAGLVLSEFFLSKATVPVDGFANYEYDTLFDEDVIKSLMLSLMGEQAYADLSMQAEIFMEMFNSTFASILDDIARENAYDIVEGQVSNFSMCVYKSYLATVLLSSDIGEYLYTIATRIFAQYTIYETLACSTGDYAGYYAYTSGQLDETGKVIDKFVYGSFYDLVKYENMFGGNSTPVFTFSMKKAFKEYAKEYKIYPNSELTDDKLNEKYAEEIATESSFKLLYTKLFKYVDDKYKQYYSVGATIPDTSNVYCFMLETYWAMQTNLVYYTGGKKTPAYLTLYRQYLTGEITRWASSKGVSVSGTDKYIAKYEQYEKSITPLRISVLMSCYHMYKPVGYNMKKDDELAEKAEEGSTPMKDFIDLLLGKVEEVEVYTTENVLRRSLSYDYLKKLKKIDIKKIYDLTESSQSGGESGNEAWLNINDLYADIGLLTSEVGEIKKLSVGDSSSSNKTPNGSIRIVEEDEVYDSMVEQLSALHQALGNYISAQSMCDKIVKASITYTLGQYGQHYVTTGYEFNIESRNYTFNANLSASRLAEYVYGGKFLIDVNALPIYTNANYNGLIRQSKEFDVDAGLLKTRLEMWPELRQFASNLANYTAKIYYQTNLKDLSENIIDNVKLTDYVNVDGEPRTLEFAILKYMLTSGSNCELDDETLIRIMFADTSETLANLSPLPIYTEITNYLESGGSIPTNAKSQLLGYLNFVYGDTYTAAGKYNSGSDTNAERIHKVFKNVMSYLLVAEDKESDEENPLNLDDITFKEFKLIVMDRIIDYEQNLTETAAQNANRYLTIFDLLNGQMNYSYNTKEGTATTSRVLTHYLDKTSGPLRIRYSSDESNVSDVNVTYSSDRSTRNVILTLAGIANRPISELVNLEYDNLYDRNGNYDEALGDIFVICFYDQRDGKYYPYLGKGTNVIIREGSKSKDYEGVFGDVMIDTKYYNAPGSGIGKVEGDAYPIIAKGMITPNMNPTAIRLVEGNVVFYRTQVLASTGVDANAVKATQTVSEVNTVGFTQTVETTSHKKVSGKASRAMFISSFDLKSFVNTDTNVFFMQNEVAYSSSPDEFGMFSVLDEFARYYNLFGMPLGLLFMAFMSVIPILFKASAAVLRRILDLLFYVLIGPVVISMTSLDYEDNGAGKMAFDKWKQGVTQALIAALGFIIGFRLYYLLTKTTLNMSFVSEATFANIQRIGGLGFVTIDFLDVIIRFMFLLTSSSMIEKAGNMLLRIISGGEVSSAFASPIGGKDVVETLQEMKDEIQKATEKVSGIYSGKAILGAKNAALEAVKSMIPGSAMVGSAVNMAKGISTNRESKKLEKDLQDKGIAKDVAKQAAKSFKENKNKQQELKDKTRLDSANNFMQTYMDGRKDTFKKAPNPLKDLSKGFKQLGEMPDKKEKPKKPKKDKPPKKKKEKKEKK